MSAQSDLTISIFVIGMAVESDSYPTRCGTIQRIVDDNRGRHILVNWTTEYRWYSEEEANEALLIA